MAKRKSKPATITITKQQLSDALSGVWLALAKGHDKTVALIWRELTEKGAKRK